MSGKDEGEAEEKADEGENNGCRCGARVDGGGDEVEWGELKEGK